MTSSAPSMKGEQLLGHLRKARLSIQLGARDAVHRECPVVDIALGVQIAVKRAARGAPVHQLDATDLDDAVIEFGFETGGFGVEDDLAHGGRESTVWQSRKASIASLASRSTRSLPGTPACPGTQCHSIWCGALASSRRSHRSWFLTGLRSAVRQPRAFQARSHSVMPRRTYCESV